MDERTEEMILYLLHDIANTLKSNNAKHTESVENKLNTAHIDVSKYISRVDDGYYYGLRNLKQYDKSEEYYRLIHFSPYAWLPINHMFDPKVCNEKLEPGNLDIATPLDIARFERWLSHLITGCTYTPLDNDEIYKYERLSYA